MNKTIFCEYLFNYLDQEIEEHGQPLTPYLIEQAIKAFESTKDERIEFINQNINKN